MTTLERFLVLLDHSAIGAAVPAAATLAAKSEGTVRLLVHGSHRWPAVLDASPQILKLEATRFLSHRLRRSAEEFVSTAFREGNVEDALAAEIAEWNPDLVILHEGQWRKKAARVSLLETCLSRSGRPVLILPEALHTAEPLAVRRVVVALDGSDLAEAALDYAVAFSRMLEVPLVLTRVVPAGPPENTDWNDAPKRLEQRMVEREDAHSYLLRVAAKLRRDDIDAEMEIATNEDPARGLIVIGSHSLLVLTSHARHGLARFLLGSTAMQVVESASGPVVVIPPVAASPVVDSAASATRASLPRHDAPAS